MPPSASCKYCGAGLIIKTMGSPILPTVFNKTASVKLCPVCDLGANRALPAVTEKVKSLQCRYCDVLWPPLEAFKRCPQCVEPTMPSLLLPPMLSIEDAQQRAREFAFSWWLWGQEGV